MDLHDVQVIFGGKAYLPNYFDLKQTPDDFPRINVDATISPFSMTSNYYTKNTSKDPTIKDVIFNPPATIVFWTDNTKTVVKADGETYDPEKGIAMAIAKKMMGDNKFEYYHIFLHWLKKWNKQQKAKETSEDDRIFDDLEAYMHDECE